jgi:hypothetical protein
MKASAIIGTNVALSPVASKTPAKMHAGQSNSSRSNAKYIFEQGQACIRLLHLLGYAHKDECRGQYGGIVLPFSGTMASDNASGRVAERLRVATARSGTRHDRLRAE